MSSSLDLDLKINETFFSIQGESTFAGEPTFFIRLTGCNLRCTYCDTQYSYFEGNKKTIGSLVEEARASGAKFVCVTGGEPMAQKNVLPLLVELCDLGLTVSLETSGSFDCALVDPRVSKIIDVKTPDSGEVDSFNFSNLIHINDKDQFKFVICSEKDFIWSRNFYLEHLVNKKCTVLFSPAHNAYSAKTLAENILREKLTVRLQIQMHKVIWSELQRGV